MRQQIGTGDPRNQILLANYEDAFGKPRNFGADLFHSIHYQSAGRAAVHLKLGEAVNVRMVPIQSGRLRRGNVQAVLEACAARLNQSVDDVVLMADGRNIHAVKVHVG